MTRFWGTSRQTLIEPWRYFDMPGVSLAAKGLNIFCFYFLQAWEVFKTATIEKSDFSPFFSTRMTAFRQLFLGKFDCFILFILIGRSLGSQSSRNILDWSETGKQRVKESENFRIRVLNFKLRPFFEAQYRSWKQWIHWRESKNFDVKGNAGFVCQKV